MPTPEWSGNPDDGDGYDEREEDDEVTRPGPNTLFIFVYTKLHPKVATEGMFNLISITIQFILLNIYAQIF